MGTGKMDERKQVSIVRCPAEAKDEEVMWAVTQAVELIGGVETAFKDKRKILVKPNIGADHIRFYKGKQVDLTEPAIVEAIVRMIRGSSDAEILIGDGESLDLYRRLGYDRIAARYPNVRLVDFGRGPYESVTVPDPVMFRYYMLSKELADVDATVSIAKMKAHHAQGATLCLKNLFGLTPKPVYGRVRVYLHDALVRLPRVLVDLGLIFRPSLCVIDGLVAANHVEWGGEPLEMGLILAGYDPITVDTIGMLVMGLDPKADYPDYPFSYHNNPLNIAKEVGLGDNDPKNIAVIGERISDVEKQFEVKSLGPAVMIDWEFKRKGKQEVRMYRDLRNEYVGKYRDRYLALRDGRPLWVAKTMDEAVNRYFPLMERGVLPYFLTRVLPEEEEVELLEVYDRCL